MSNGHHRSRAERVAAMVSHKGLLDQIEEKLFDRHGTTRFGLTLFTAAVLCVLIQAWNPPFVFQLFKTPERDVVCVTPFSVEAPQKTNDARNDARLDTPHVYVNDGAKLTQFKARLSNTVQSLLSFGSYEQMPVEDRIKWRTFLPPEVTDEEAAAKFSLLQQALEKDIELANFKASIDRAFSPYSKNGILQKLHGTREGNQEKIRIYDMGTSPEGGREVPVGDVLIGNAYLMKDLLNVDFSRDVAEMLFQSIRPEIVETLSEDRDATMKSQNLAESLVEPVFTNHEPGQVLARGSKEIDRDTFTLLRQEYRVLLSKRSWIQKAIRMFGVFVFVGMTLALAGAFIRTRLAMNRVQTTATFKTFLTVFSLMALTVLMGRLLQVIFDNQGGNPEMVPILVFAQGMAIAFSWEVAIITAFIITICLTLSGTFELSSFLVLLGTVTLVVILSRDIRRRGRALMVACMGGGTAFVLSYAAGLFQTQQLQHELIPDAIFRMVWGVLAGFVMSGLLPFIERAFDILTPMRLLEIGNPSHPLLQELARRAPSTYNHSMQTAAIAEAAAESIGARGALVRVGGYFHDIGKMLKPEYFTENQNGVNLHEQLEPRMSTLIVVSHIKDGVDLARQYRLPEAILDLLEQHHGTMLVSFFYDKANKISRETAGQELDESSFRYPGPTPQSKEAGILMLADAVESACRSLGDVAPNRIENLVRQLSAMRMEDGQFDHSGLTLGEIRTIENSMISSILAMKHSRIKYPEKEIREKTLVNHGNNRPS